MRSQFIGAVDIGGTKIAVGLVNAEGEVRAREEFPTDAGAGFDCAMNRITEALHRLSKGLASEVHGIGIGCTGPIHPLSGTFGNINFMPTWEGYNPVEALAQEFKVQVALENDADAAALGEAHWGAGRGKKRLVYVTVGTGIGVAIIIDGDVYRSASGAHPEIGHHVIEADGPLCSCGAHGCWEALAAGPAMVSWLQSEAPKDFPPSRDLTAKRICKLAEAGERWALRAVEREARYLGIGLANVIAFLVPDAIVLGGSVMNSFHLFESGIRRELRNNCFLVPAEEAELKLASMGKDAALAGAASVWHHRFAKNEECL